MMSAQPHPHSVPLHFCISFLEIRKTKPQCPPGCPAEQLFVSLDITDEPFQGHAGCVEVAMAVRVIADRMAGNAPISDQQHSRRTIDAFTRREKNGFDPSGSECVEDGLVPSRCLRLPARVEPVVEAERNALSNHETGKKCGNDAPAGS